MNIVIILSHAILGVALTEEQLELANPSSAILPDEYSFSKELQDFIGFFLFSLHFFLPIVASL